MSKVTLVLIALICAGAAVQAQSPSSYGDHSGTWVRGHWERVDHHQHWVPAHWTTAQQAGEEYKEVEVATETRPAIGKFVDDHWSWQDGRMVYRYKTFAPVDPQEASFSAAALNARLTRPDVEGRVAKRGLGEM